MPRMPHLSQCYVEMRGPFFIIKWLDSNWVVTVKYRIRNGTRFCWYQDRKAI